MDADRCSWKSPSYRFILKLFVTCRKYLRGFNGAPDGQIVLSTHSADLLRDEGIGLDEVFLLEPGKEGTEVSVASAFADIKELLDGGVALPDAIIPRTKPQSAAQLSLFGDLER